MQRMCDGRRKAGLNIEIEFQVCCRSNFINRSSYRVRSARIFVLHFEIFFICTVIEFLQVHFLNLFEGEEEYGIFYQKLTQK